MPDPSDLKVIKSDANSWTVEIWDSEGISHVDVFYGRLPYVYRHRVSVHDCAPGMTIDIPKSRKFFLRSLPFHLVSVCDCSRSDTNAFVVSRFRIDEKGKVTEGLVFERDPSMQELLDRAEHLSQRNEFERLVDKAFKIMVMLVLLAILILALRIYWSAIGPLWGG